MFTDKSKSNGYFVGVSLTWEVESAVRLCPCIHVTIVIREGEEEEDEALGGREGERRNVEEGWEEKDIRHRKEH